MIKAVIFDVDGVLIDNSSLIVKVYQEDARIAGLTVPDEKTIMATFGLPWQEMVEILLGKDERYKQIHIDTWPQYADQMVLAPGVIDVLKELKQAKGIVTSKPRESLNKHLKELLLYFKSIITVEDTIRHKPDPEPLLKALEQLMIEPKEAIYIGDHFRDFEMAKNAGTDFIGMLSGAMSKHDFKIIGAFRTIYSLTELLDIIK